MTIKKRVGLIVAHPDDEVLWAGGTILLYPDWDWHIYSLCRASDPDRSMKFRKVLKELGATGAMADLDDGPEQMPLDESEVESTIIRWLADEQFDLLITHGLEGEYTRHLRHEETSKAVTKLVLEETIKANELWHFAYEDGHGTYKPRAADEADLTMKLPSTIWRKKYELITNLYGFDPDSWEALTTPKTEAFLQYHSVTYFQFKQKYNEGISVI